MTTIERSPSSSSEPQVVTDDNSCVWVAPFTPISFYPRDKVYLLIPGGSRDGPYKIAQMASAGKYILCDNDGQKVRNGEEIEEKNLEAVQALI